ncbi:VOC family protein [Caproicibacter fermentans]|uniref:VOC family protein n=1 Tax=Caproicibacter fermentans TaxID=2576756 RepID=A0A7G8T6H6_9FIRM|nr:VOC family protein [Caproicibacter fermentans]QNK39217.1 VOC family protein [Caproicibacter fermentans]
MEPVVDHIHLTVRDLDRAEQFYDRFLPLLGFEPDEKEYDAVVENEYRIVEYHHRNGFSFGIVNARPACSGEPVNRRKPGALHHLAFHAPSRAEVDQLYEKVEALGAEIVHSPKFYPEYCADYYAFFFKDSEGIELEIVHYGTEEKNETL